MNVCVSQPLGNSHGEGEDGKGVWDEVALLAGGLGKEMSCDRAG